MRYLSVEEVLFIHFQVVERFGGSHGVLNTGGLESAVARPQATMGGQELYGSSLHKAAALAQSLVMNHPFSDGNKRTAFTALGVFLSLNGLSLVSSPSEAEAFVLRIAEHSLGLESIVDWLGSHTRAVDL